MSCISELLLLRLVKRGRELLLLLLQCCGISLPLGRVSSRGRRIEEA